MVSNLEDSWFTFNMFRGAVDVCICVCGTVKAFVFKARRELTRITMPSDAGSLKVPFVMSFNHLLEWRRILKMFFCITLFLH